MQDFTYLELKFFFYSIKNSEQKLFTLESENLILLGILATVKKTNKK